jgi:hypothetical protein
MQLKHSKLFLLVQLKTKAIESIENDEFMRSWVPKPQYKPFCRHAVTPLCLDVNMDSSLRVVEHQQQQQQQEEDDRSDSEYSGSDDSMDEELAFALALSMQATTLSPPAVVQATQEQEPISCWYMCRHKVKALR